MNEADTADSDRWPIYHLLIVVTIAIAAGRIAVVKSPEGDTAFLSANDRSRWSTVASLVERGTYVIDQQIAMTDPIRRNRRPWDSIDKVRHLGRDGKQHYYSSKPPLLATAVAGVYQVVLTCTGMTLTEQPIYVARIILALVNLPLLAIFFYATLASIDRLIRTRWAAGVSAAACCLGTMVLPFVVSLNNHLPACTATAVVMWVYVRLATGGEGKLRRGESIEISFQWALLAGLCAALAAANELPALSMTVFWFLLFTWMSRASVIPFAIGTLLVAAAFFGTNWIAHQSLRPPYAHRGNGAVIAELNSTGDQPGDAMIAEIEAVLRREGLSADTEPEDAAELKEPVDAAALEINPSDEPGRWIVQIDERLFALLQHSSGWRLAHWDDWYEYPGTYWKDGTRQGVDRGEPSRLVYFLHLTIGHHGLFSLTPLWLLMPFGLILGVFREPAEMRRLMVAVLVASVVCFLFYLSRPLIDRNYGGVSVSFRWLLWFSPLWLLAISPVIEGLAKGRWRRVGMMVLLASSVFSVAASLQTPWQSPWLYRFWQFLGWLSV